LRAIEDQYKSILEDVRRIPSKLYSYSYEAATDNTGNQLARQRLLIALKNYKRSSDYSIASFLFDEEVKAKHYFDQIEDYNPDILELSALILVSFHNVQDILKMVNDHPNQNDTYVEVDPRVFLLYGKDTCFNFLKNSIDPNAKIALEKLERFQDEITPEILEDLRDEFNEYYSVFQFPITDVIEFSINTEDPEVARPEANKWFLSITQWDEFEVRKGLKIAEMIDDPSFTSKMNIVKEQFVKEHKEKTEIREKERTVDQKISKQTNNIGVVFFLLIFIFFIGTSISAVMLSSIYEDTLSERLPYYLVSLITLVIGGYTWKGIKSANTNDLIYFKEEYLSGNRSPEIDWTYTSNRWNKFAQDYFKKLIKTQRIILSCIAIFFIILGVVFQDITLISIMVWASIGAIIFYYLNGYKDYEEKKDAFLNTRPLNVKIYNKGLIIGNKYYYPFNTRYVWLLGFEVIEKEGIHFLEITRNIRAGEYPDANINKFMIPIPEGKEDEARGLGIYQKYLKS